VRDYEVVKVEQEVPNEFLLVFDDGTFKVFENPRFGARAKKGFSILQSRDNYILAAAQAQRVGRKEAEAYALAAAQAR